MHAAMNYVRRIRKERGGLGSMNQKTSDTSGWLTCKTMKLDRFQLAILLHNHANSLYRIRQNF